MSGNPNKEIARLAKLAKAAGYTTPGQVIARLEHIIGRQQAIVAMKKAQRRYSRADGEMEEDSQAMAAAIAWLECFVEE